MNKPAAIIEFIAIYFYDSKEDFKRSRKSDPIAVREMWFEFTDSLCKSGDITENQYNNWAAIC